MSYFPGTKSPAEFNGQYIEDNYLDVIWDISRNGDTNVITDWFYPQDKEHRQMAQELFMTDRQNQWNSAQEQMKRVKEAGINPLTAAGAIAGNGTSSATAVPQPASSVNPIGDVAGAVGSLSGGFGSVAKGLSDLSTKKETDTLLHEKLRNLRNDADLKFEQAGLTKSQAVIAAASAEYADENELRDIQMKRVRVKQMSQEYKNLKAVHEQILADIDDKIASAELKGSQQDYYTALKLKTDEETRYLKETNDFWDANKFDRFTNANDLIISQIIANGGDPDDYIQAWIDYHGQYQGAVSFAEAEAKNTSDELHGRIGSPADLAGRIAKIGTDWITKGLDDAVSFLKGNLSARQIRNELQLVLDNSFDQLEKYPEDKERLTPIISDIQMALSLSNKELKKWYDSNWK